MSSYKGYSQWARGGVGSSYSSASSASSSLGSTSGVGSKYSSSLGLKSMETARSPSRESSYSSSLSSGSSIRPTTPTNRYSSISSRMKDTSSTGISSYSSAGKSNLGSSTGSSYSKEKSGVSSYGIGGGSVSSLTSRFGSTLGSSTSSNVGTAATDSSSSGSGNASSTFRTSGTSGYIRAGRESSFSKAPSNSTTGSTGYADETSSSNNSTSTKRYSGSSSASTPTTTTTQKDGGREGDGNSSSISNSTGNSSSSASNAGGTSPSIGSSGLSSYKPYTTRSLLSSDIKPITAPATPASSLRTTARYGLKSGPSHAHYSVSLPTASTLKAAAMLTEEAKKQLSKSQYQKEKEETKQLREIEEMTSWHSRGTCTILDSLDDEDEYEDEEDGEKMKANEISNEEEPTFTPRIFSPRYDGVLKHKAVQTDEEPKSKYAGLTAIPRPPLTMNFNSPFTAVMNRFNAEKSAKAAAASESSTTTAPVTNTGGILGRRGSLKKTTSNSSPDSTSSSSNNLTKDAKMGSSNATAVTTSNSSSSSDQLSRSSLSRQTSPASRRNSINKSRTTDGPSTMTQEQGATTKKLTTKASSPPATTTTTLNAGGLVVNLANKEFVRKSVLNVGAGATAATKEQSHQDEYGRKQEVSPTMQQKSSAEASVASAANNDDNESSANTSNNTRSSPLSTGLKRDSTRRPPTDPNKSSVTNQLNRSISRMSSQYNLANNANANNNSSANSSRASSPSHAGSATGNCNSSPAAGAPGLSRIKSTKNINPLRKLSLENSNASDSDSSLSVTSSSAAAVNSKSIGSGSGISKLKKKLGTATSDSDNNNNNTPAVVTAASGGGGAIDKRNSPLLRRGSTTGGGTGGGGGTTCSSTASSRSASVERSNAGGSISTNAPIPSALHPSLKKSLSKSDNSRAGSLRASPASSSSDSEKKKKGPVTIKISQEQENLENNKNYGDAQDADSSSYFGGGSEGEPPKQTPFFLRMMNDTPWVRKCQSGELPWWMASNPDVPGTLGRNPSRSVIKVPTTKDIQEELAAGGGMLLSPKQNVDDSSSSSELSDMECDDDALENKMAGPLGERTSPDGTEIPSVGGDNSIVKGDGKQLFIGTHRNIDDILGFLPANLLAPSPSPAPNTPTPSATNAALQEAMDELVEAQRKLSLVGRSADHDKSDDEDEESESESSSSSELSDDEEDNLHKSSIHNKDDSASSDEDEDSTGTSSSFAEVDPINMTIKVPPKEPSEPLVAISQEAAALVTSSKSEKSNGSGARCDCHESMFRERLAKYLGKTGSSKCSSNFRPTQFIVDDKYYLFPPAKPLQRRPLWGVPSNQWEIDAANGKRGYKDPNFESPRTPLPSYFQPLSTMLAETCLIDDEEKRKHIPILSCVTPYCPRKYIRAINRDFRGKRPKGSTLREPVPIDEDPFLKKLMQEMQVVFDEFLARKVPIIWIYGRPLKTVAATRRNYCLSLAETHGFTYISLDEEIAMLAARGSRAIQDGNPLFEGFLAVERLALPVCIKLATDKKYVMSRTETIDMLKFLMLKYFPTKGYIIDGFPWDNFDNEDFERAFYPIACGLYFLDSYWTSNKASLPPIIPPLYFRRDVDYDENDVEEACGLFGLKTLKIIGAESLLDDDEKIFALHAVVDEYLEAYDEVLEGNDDVLKDDTLEFQTFGETTGYGLDLAEYMKKKEPEGGDQAGLSDGGRPHLLELDKLKEMGWDGTKGEGMYSSATFDLGPMKVTPSQRKMLSQSDEGEEEQDGDGKKRRKRRGHHKHDHEDDEPCPEGDVVCEEKKKEKKKRSKKRGRKHRCRCRCRCNRRSRDYPRYEGDDDRGGPGRQSDQSHPPHPRRGRDHPRDGDDDMLSDGFPGGGDGASDRDSNRSRPGDKGRGKGRRKTPDSESQLDEDMEPEGPLVYDKRWGYRSTKRSGKHPGIHLPRLNTTNDKSDLVGKEDDLDKRAKENVGVYALPHTQSHNIPDPYNTIPHRPGDKPGDYLQDYPGPKAPDRYSKINRRLVDPEDAPNTVTPYTEEPTSGLRSLYSDTMSRVMAKNQADVRKIKYDKLKHKVGQVEYEIYQDDYRLPKYRFYKTYKDFTPEDFVKEKENYVPCANCFDSFKQADQFNKGEQVMNLTHLQHDKREAQEEHEHQYGKGPLFNRIISCLCGEDNEAGFHIPGYKPAPKMEDNTDLEHFDETPDYRKKK